MSSVVQNLLDNTLGDGARSSKFECLVHFPSSHLFPNNEEVIALTKTSQFPGKSHDVINVKYKGRTIPIKGQVKYDNTWSCTFYMTQDHALKIAFEHWIESLDQVHNMAQTLSQDVRRAQFDNNSGYTIDMSIAQMDFHGDQITAMYVLHNVFPKSVSAIDVDYSETGRILEMTVEFSYSHYDMQIYKSGTDTFIDDIKSKGQDLISRAADGISGLAGGATGLATGAAGDAVGVASDMVSGPDDMAETVDDL